MPFTSFFSFVNLKPFKASSLQALGRCQERLYDQSIEFFCPLSSPLCAACSSQKPSLEGTSLWSSSSSDFDIFELLCHICTCTGQMGGREVQVKWSIALPWLFISRSKPLHIQVCSCLCLLFEHCCTVIQCLGWSEETVLLQAKCSTVKVLCLLRILTPSAHLSPLSQVYKTSDRVGAQ